MIAEGKIGSGGIIRLPPSVRARVDMPPGTAVTIEADGDGIRIRPTDEPVRRPRRTRRGRLARRLRRKAEDRLDVAVSRARLDDPSREVVPWERARAELLERRRRSKR